MIENEKVLLEGVAHILYDYLIAADFSEVLARYLNMLALLVATTIILVVIQLTVRRIIITTASRLANLTKVKFDDILVKNKFPRSIARIVPLFVAAELIPIVFIDFQYTENLAIKGLQIFAIVMVLWIARSFLNTLKDYFKTLPNLKDKPIDSYIQVFMIFAWTIGIVSIFAVITNISFLKFFTTIGAASAIIILIFRDTILGFVASIQVSINDMVRIGDWITFEKYGADGDVTEINLATVKVQNFDKTITTIPTYALISDSFKNWRGMTNSAGRRIKRALLIKQNSVKFIDLSTIENLKKIELIAPYLSNRQGDIDKYNSEHNIDKTLLINGRNMTNLGVFRKYIENYLHKHSAINKDMMIMARQLPPTAEGIPVEVYAFSSDKRWENYEYIMADIFDHLIAAIKYFDLELFELPNNSSFIERTNRRNNS
ncbi:MAG: mechanosensitive ion channel [Chitinophagales bacterium]